MGVPTTLTLDTGVRDAVGVARVVSLVPSVTECLLAWGIVPAACTRFCERADLPHVGGTKDPDVDAIVALQPDLVVLDAEENRQTDFETLVARGLPVWTLHIRAVDDVAEQLPLLAAALGVSWELPALPISKPPRQSAFIPIWRRPWMALGAPTYGHSVLTRLGFTNVFATVGPYPVTSLEHARQLRPDRVIAPSEPYRFSERNRKELETVAPATFVDGKDLFWWGVRTADALRRLQTSITPV